MSQPDEWWPDKRLLTIEEAAKSCGRPASTVRRWIGEGRLTRAARMGHRNLYLESDVLRVEAEARRSSARQLRSPATRERPGHWPTKEEST